MEFFFLYSIFAIFENPLYALVLGFNQMDAWLVWVLTAGLFAVLYALKAAGLYTMAKKAGKAHIAWCAFVPFASTFLMGELAETLYLGGLKIKHLGIFAAVLELLLCAAYAMQYIPLSYIYSQGEGQLYTVIVEAGADGSYAYLEFTDALNPSVERLMDVASILQTVFYLLYTVAAAVLFVAFFRVYCPMSYIWMVILCVIIPVFTAPLVYAYRNRGPVDYEKWMAARAAQLQRMQQRYGEGGPYGGGPYGGSPYGPEEGPKPADPFGEFSDGEDKDKYKDDPFGGLSDKKDGPGGSDGPSQDGNGGDGGSFS